MAKRTSEEHRKAAATVIARNGTYEEAGARAGVSRQTISRWMKTERFQALVSAELDRIAEKGNPLAELVELPPPSGLDKDWRNRAAEDLAMAVRPAVKIVRDAMNGDADISRAQLDTAKWLIERLAIDAPQEVADDEIVSRDDMVSELAELPVDLLRAAIEQAG